MLFTVSTVKEKLPPEFELDDTMFDRTDVWLTDYDTSRLRGGMMLAGDDAGEKHAARKLIVHIDGTKKYRAADGKDREVPLARPFNLEEWIDAQPPGPEK